MRKALVTLTAAGSLALAGAAVPSKAEAHAWVVPVIVGAAIGGILVGAIATRAQASPFRAYYGDSNCFTQRERVRGKTRLVQYCN